MGVLDRLKAFFRLGALPPGPRRLDGRSKALLAASFNMLPDEEPGWITMMEAATLFSPKRDAHAFGELDEVGKANLGPSRRHQGFSSSSCRSRGGCTSCKNGAIDGPGHHRRSRGFLRGPADRGELRPAAGPAGEGR
jgi:hypothetical protein